MQADPRHVLSSRFGAGRVTAAGIPTVNHLEAQPWIQLSKLYLQSERPLLTYALARAARSIAPDNVDSYLAVAQAAVRIGGGRPIAMHALESAVRIDGDDQRAQSALRQLKSFP